MVVGSNSYADQGRAKVEARNAGVVRVYADRDRGVIKGRMSIRAWHVYSGLAWTTSPICSRGQSSGPKLRALCCSSRSYHPMFEEGLKTALREICEAVGSPELKDMDFVAAPGA
jgi:dihydrolipoamide dehydrogenase